jgi:hypothetical protein
MVPPALEQRPIGFCSKPRPAVISACALRLPFSQRRSAALNPARASGDRPAHNVR